MHKVRRDARSVAFKQLKLAEFVGIVIIVILNMLLLKGKVSRISDSQIHEVMTTSVERDCTGLEISSDFTLSLG